ncbi:MAG: hypothetical protein H3C49_06760 [Alphaproteobacteria bacterium]|nr:hypothetical protein [Alphaproteobacteria bacterium]
MSIETLSHAQYIALAYAAAGLILLLVMAQSVLGYLSARRAARMAGVDIRRGDDAAS